MNIESDIMEPAVMIMATAPTAIIAGARGRGLASLAGIIMLIREYDQSSITTGEVV